MRPGGRMSGWLGRRKKERGTKEAKQIEIPKWDEEGNEEGGKGRREKISGMKKNAKASPGESLTTQMCL